MAHDDKFTALQAQVADLQTTVSALLAQPAAKSFDSEPLLERLNELEAQVCKQNLNQHDGIEKAVGRIHASVVQKMNKGLQDFAKVAVDEAVGAEERIRSEVKDTKRQLENQVSDASSALLRLASLQEITAKTSSDRIVSWLQERV